MTHTRMCQECPVSLEKLSFFFIQVKIIQVLVFDNWHPLKDKLTRFPFLLLLLAISVNTCCPIFANFAIYDKEFDVTLRKLTRAICRDFFFIFSLFLLKT